MGKLSQKAMSPSDYDLTYQNQSTESKIVASLERISQAFRVLLWQESMAFSLSPIQVQILIFLLYHSSDKRTVSYLAEELNVTKATISDAIKSLDSKKLIKKTVNPGDTRSYIIHLTTRGKEIAGRTSLFTRELHEPLNNWSTEEKNSMLLNLLDIIRHLNKAGVITVQRMCANCTYYQSGEGRQHYCSLLNQNLSVADLRIDCPEHQLYE